MKRFIPLLFALCAAFSLHAQNDPSSFIDLSGSWQFALDADGSLSPSSALSDVVQLPGTTDTNKKGSPLSYFDETTHLSRRYYYKGRAWYSREILIPKSWKKKSVLLFLELTKFTEVYLDGSRVGQCNDISTPQVYQLPRLKPGRHVLTIMVDNSSGVPQQVYGSSHAYTEDTQTNWNGVIGRLGLYAVPQTKSKASAEGALASGLISPANSASSLSRRTSSPSQSSSPSLSSSSSLSSSPSLSSSSRKSNPSGLFSPSLFSNYTNYSGQSPVPAIFRNFEIRGKHFYADSHRIFLRGRHDACVWPLTGHVAMDNASWRHYFEVCKEYGLNHVRFHSWCPPEAAFAMADSMGIILQPELPFWGDFKAEDSLLMTFLHKEGENIMRWYGHHPSFRMFALGNELWGSIEKMREFVDDFRHMAPDKVFTFGSNYYLGYQGVKPGMDYFTTCRVGGEGWGNYNTHTRGSFSFADAADGGMINHFHPNTTMNFDEGCALSSVPVISHETAQFQTYPDYAEISKYTGVLQPCNIEIFRKRLEKAGMSDQAADFHRASGLWSMQLYKQDVEMDLRTRDMAGFQLLDLQDYPGQGSAYVGVLDAFLDSKGLITPLEWRGFCSEVVPMAIMDRFCFTDDEPLRVRFQVANYGGQSLKGQTLRYFLKWNEDGSLKTQSHQLTIDTDEEGLIDVGSADVPFPKLGKPMRFTLSLEISGRGEHNDYPIWIYPSQTNLEPLKNGILLARDLSDDVVRQLSEGASVLLMPDSTDLCVGGLFQTDYWNYRMFKTISENNKRSVSPGTLGILCNPQHPLLRLFPTEDHSSWQWFPVVKESHPFILDNTSPNYRPIVQVIDNIERNHKLGLVFEFKVGIGRLLVVMSNLEQAAQYPEGRQFYASVLSYMHSADFAPATSITSEQLRLLFSTKVNEEELKELNNISPY